MLGILGDPSRNLGFQMDFARKIGFATGAVALRAQGTPKTRGTLCKSRRHVLEWFAVRFSGLRDSWDRDFPTISQTLPKWVNQLETDCSFLISWCKIVLAEKSIEKLKIMKESCLPIFYIYHTGLCANFQLPTRNLIFCDFRWTFSSPLESLL